MDSDARHALSPAHAGALAARMLILEEDCREIDHNLDGSHGIFREYAGQIPEATKEQIRAMLVLSRFWIRSHQSNWTWAFRSRRWSWKS